MPNAGVARAIILHLLQFGEELLHQPFLVGLEHVQLLRPQGYDFVEEGEAVGDPLLFF